MTHTAKLFLNGRSQAVRLPAPFRFEGSEVYIRRDERTGDVILSQRPTDWRDFFALADASEAPQDFPGERDKSPPPARTCDLREQARSTDCRSWTGVARATASSLPTHSA